MYNVSAVGGCPGAECYLVATDRGTALIDSGFGFCAQRTVDNIEAVLYGRPLDYILLTHSHYDHILGSPAVKERHPGAKVVASRYAAKVMAREGARRTMRTLHTAAAENAGFPTDNSMIDRLAVDLAVADGDELLLGDGIIQVVATPGHTNCCVSYFFRDERLLAAAETIGVVLQYPQVVPGMLVSYRDTMNSIARVEALEPSHLLSPHHGMIPDGGVEEFFINSRTAVEEAMQYILERYHRGMSLEEIVTAFKARFYGEVQARFQPEQAFDMNTRAMVPRVLAEIAAGDKGKTA